MSSRSAITATDVVIGLVIVVAIVIAVVAVMRMDTFGERAGAPDEDVQDDRPAIPEIDPALIKYTRTAEIPVAMQQVRSLATGPDGRIYVGGDATILVFDADGTQQGKIELDGEPNCVAVGGNEHLHPGRVYVGMKDRVAVYDPQGELTATWDTLGRQALLTSITAAEEDVFVADAGNRVVMRYDTDGSLINRIGEPDQRRGIPGFVITSSYFDLAVSPDGLLRVVNPRALRIEAYTFDGDLETFWGKSSPGIDGFFGCCNPVHFAVLPDGRFVTAEKGATRVKIYDSGGTLVCVVAGPQEFDILASEVLADVAVDRGGRVLVLDPKARSVRIFSPQGGE